MQFLRSLGQIAKVLVGETTFHRRLLCFAIIMNRFRMIFLVAVCLLERSGSEMSSPIAKLPTGSFNCR